MAKVTGFAIEEEAIEDTVVIEEPTPVADPSLVKMVRGDICVDVAPQDVSGFKSAGYTVIN